MTYLQTKMFQVHVRATSWKFESYLRHHSLTVGEKQQCDFITGISPGFPFLVPLEGIKSVIEF